jgi:hypothetical protein
MHRASLLLAFTVLAGGCSSSSSARFSSPDRSDSEVLATSVAGTWSRTQLVIGSSLVMTLAVRDSTITGTGTYAIEAGRSGTLTVRGMATGGVVKLDLAFDYGEQAHFSGAPDSSGALTGAIKYGPADGMQPSQIAVFKRK